MNRSEGALIAGRVRDEVCVRGCTLRGVHFATCDDYGREPVESTCRGCAPAPVHPGSAICGRCFGRMRSLLRDAPDLVGRLRSLSDPMKAMLIEPVKVFGRPVEAVAPVGPDLLDAADAILANLRDWAHHLPHPSQLPSHSRTAGMSTVDAFALTREYAQSIDVHLDTATADPSTALHLAEALLVLHPEVEGERPGWSVADAMGRWGAERRERHVHPDAGAEDEVEEEQRVAVSEWNNPLITKVQAAKIAGSERTLRRWEKDGRIASVGRVTIAGVRTSWYRAADVITLRNAMRAAESENQFKSKAEV